MLTAILVVAILSLVVSSLAALCAAGAFLWARACHTDADYLMTAILREQGEARDLLEEHSQYLDRIDENLLVVNDTTNELERLARDTTSADDYWKAILANEGLVVKHREVPAS
jgi:hypothetical protein